VSAVKGLKENGIQAAAERTWNGKSVTVSQGRILQQRGPRGRIERAQSRCSCFGVIAVGCFGNVRRGAVVVVAVRRGTTPQHHCSFRDGNTVTASL
jgi:hypothetical protein